jgi:hypothetical protein
VEKYKMEFNEEIVITKLLLLEKGRRKQVRRSHWSKQWLLKRCQDSQIILFSQKNKVFTPRPPPYILN